MRNKGILFLTGITLFFLVVSVLYLIISIQPPLESQVELQVFIPFIVLSGFFIFLIGAFLVALSIFKLFDR